MKKDRMEVWKLKYRNTKLSIAQKYKKVRLTFAVFASNCLY